MPGTQTQDVTPSQRRRPGAWHQRLEPSKADIRLASGGVATRAATLGYPYNQRVVPVPSIPTGNLLDPTGPIVFSLLAGPAVDDPLKELLPAAVISALEVTSEQIQLLVIEPLLVSDPDDLGQRFSEVFGRFAEFYLSGALLAGATLGADFGRFASIAPRSFETCEDLVRNQMHSWLGRDAGLAVLRGLTTVQRVVIGTLRTMTDQKSRALLEDAGLVELANRTIAYFQALGAVVWALNGRISIPIRRENVIQLAYWSANYASDCYAIARAKGLLRPANSLGPLPAADPEDVELADAGLNDYAEMLSSEEFE